MLKLKLQYFGHLMQRVDSLEKTDAGRDWGQEEKGTTEDQMAGWHHQLNGREFEWTPGVGDGQGGLACCDSWGRRVGHNWETELNWTEHVHPVRSWMFTRKFVSSFFSFFLLSTQMIACDTHLSASCFSRLIIHLAYHSTLGYKEHSYSFYICILFHCLHVLWFIELLFFLWAFELILIF